MVHLAKTHRITDMQTHRTKGPASEPERGQGERQENETDTDTDSDIGHQAPGTRHRAQGTGHRRTRTRTRKCAQTEQGQRASCVIRFRLHGSDYTVLMEGTTATHK